MSYLLAQAEPLKIDWATGPTYNTIMSVATGVALLLIVSLGYRLVIKRHEVLLEGWALAFAVLGFILTATGLHMTLTWPLAPIGFPFDNIIFGEPSLAFGVMLLAAAFYLWKRSNDVAVDATVVAERSTRLVRVLEPISWFAAAMGLACIAIAAAGIDFTLFAAPPQEPISGNFSDHPMLEATFISGLYFLIGLGALLLPFALPKLNRALLYIIGICWTISGLAFALFGALNFYTHIGLIIHTM